MIETGVVGIGENDNGTSLRLKKEDSFIVSPLRKKNMVTRFENIAFVKYLHNRKIREMAFYSENSFFLKSRNFTVAVDFGE